ncbi:hypothetical protein DFH06DRAFT_53971 [Mycena polygramma]|nr:hypothetical protein DFH06DRAFT_53971 [Mycena polygramma]
MPSSPSPPGWTCTTRPLLSSHTRETTAGQRIGGCPSSRLTLRSSPLRYSRRTRSRRLVAAARPVYMSIGASTPSHQCRLPHLAARPLTRVCATGGSRRARASTALVAGASRRKCGPPRGSGEGARRNGISTAPHSMRARQRVRTLRMSRERDRWARGEGRGAGLGRRIVSPTTKAGRPSAMDFRTISLPARHGMARHHYEYAGSRASLRRADYRDRTLGLLTHFISGHLEGHDTFQRTRQMAGQDGLALSRVASIFFLLGARTRCLRMFDTA